MRVLKKLALLVPSRRRAAERDMREELEALHEIAEPGELGNLTLAAEDARGEMTWLSLERLAQDLRYGLRSMRRDPMFAGLVVASLALGIGANTAIYSFMDSVLLRPLPVQEPNSLVVMKWAAKDYALASHGMSWSTGGSSRDGGNALSSIFPYRALDMFQQQRAVLRSAFAYFVEPQLSVTVGDRTDSLLGQYVSGGYFDGMGVAPAAGRLLGPADDSWDAPAAAVVSTPFARRRFGDAHAAVGQTVRVNNAPVTVVGVVPDGFFGAEPGAIPDVYRPLHASAMSKGTVSDDHFYWIEVMGRLQPGVSLEQAQARLAPAFLHFVASTATDDRQKQDLPQLRVQDGSTGLDSLRRRYAQAIYVLMAMVASILFIACTNVANLLLARGAARRREIAIRLSVGASRWRVVRQLLTESLLLSVIGGALGLAIAAWGIRVLTVLLANGRDNFTLHAALNANALLVTTALSMLTGVLFGLAPALQATRVHLAPALKDAGLRDTPRSSRRFALGPALVVMQVALSLLLLVSAVLFDRTLASLHAIPLGFNREHTLLFTIRPYTVGYEGKAASRLFEDLRERLRELPGVRNVSLSIRALPMGGGTLAPVTLDGSPAAARTPVVLGSVGPDFFTAMQIPLVAGRDFTGRDDASAPRVVVINRRLASAMGIADPLGHSIGIRENRYEIVGVAENALSFSLKESPRAALYLPYLQDSFAPRQMTYMVRTLGDPLDLAEPVRAAVRRLDARIAVHDMTTQASYVDQAISTEITLARLCSAFALLALVIACVGLYGTVAFNVARRTTEIGIRAALGASAGRIVWMILRDVCLMAAAGLVLGLPLALAGSRYVKTFLYGIAPNDPAAIAAAVAVLLAAGLLAGFIPARSASRIDPLMAMRCE